MKETFFTVEKATEFYVANGGHGNIIQVIRDTGVRGGDDKAWLVQIHQSEAAKPEPDEVVERCEKCRYPSSNETQCINCGTCLVCAWNGAPGTEDMCHRCDRRREYWIK